MPSIKNSQASSIFIDQCSELISDANNIVVLTGAGISTNAGIPDFRGPKGLYVTRQYDPDTVFDIDYFLTDPKPFYDFARDFISFEEKIKPTFAHYFLAELEKQGKLKGVVTQNIDALHERAGSKKVFEMHGSFWHSFCLACHREFSYDIMKTKVIKEAIPKCSCSGVIKPDIVFFGENVKHLKESHALAEQADLFFIIGTSCVVQPAASIPYFAQNNIIVVNKDDIAIDLKRVDLTVKTDIDEFFKGVAKELNLAF